MKRTGGYLIQIRVMLGYASLGILIITKAIWVFFFFGYLIFFFWGGGVLFCSVERVNISVVTMVSEVRNLLRLIYLLELRV